MVALKMKFGSWYGCHVLCLLMFVSVVVDF